MPYAEESIFNEFLTHQSPNSDFLLLQEEIPAFISLCVSVRLSIKEIVAHCVAQARVGVGV